MLRTRIYAYTFPNDPKQILYFETRENPKGIGMAFLSCSVINSQILKTMFIDFYALGLCKVCPNQDKALIVFPAKKCGAIEITVRLRLITVCSHLIKFDHGS